MEQEITEDWILSLHVGAPTPDMVVFLDCNPEEIVKRVGVDFGAKNLERQKKIRKSYREIFTRFDAMKVNAQNTKHQIATEIWNNVQKIIN